MPPRYLPPDTPNSPRLNSLGWPITIEGDPALPTQADLDNIEVLTHATSVITRYEREVFLERWFGTDQGLIHFAWEAVKTLDEHDAETPLKALPREAYLLDHFQNILREPVYVVLKSRQIMITWATFIAATWLTMRRQFCKIGLFPKKSDDGKDHIEDRIQNTIWISLPRWLRADYEAAQPKGVFQLVRKRPWPQLKSLPHVPGRWDSWIAAFEKGPNQGRQYTLTYAWWDEMAYQQYARKAWHGTIPTVGSRAGKGGRVWAVSTMVPGSFHDVLCGDNATVDLAVEIALGNVPAPPSGFYQNPQPGVVHYRNHKYGAFVAVYSFLADSTKRAAIWEQEEALRLGGKDSPEWLLDYRMQRQAFRGVLVYPHFDRRWNVVPAREVDRECEIFLSVDFGHTVPTAIGFWEWNEREQRLTGFDEIYLTNTTVEMFKKLIRFQLAARLNLPVEDVDFAEHLGYNVADPEAPGTMLEYAQSPSPLIFTGNPQADSGQKPWKINDRATGEMRLDSALRPSFIHCGTRQYAADGKMSGICQGIIVDDAGQKSSCQTHCTATPMMTFMEGRMPNLERELPLQQRIDQNDPALEAPDRNKKGVPDHAADYARYAVMRYPNFFNIEALDKPVPRFMSLGPEKLTATESFWREKYLLAEQSADNRIAFEEAGEIGYPDDGGDDDVYA